LLLCNLIPEPHPPVANPCYNRVLIGVVPAFGQLQQLADEVIG
jgi:hypothetical protein